MKQTPEEAKIRRNFEPGILSKDGFLGNDERHIHDIVQEDLHTLSRLGIQPDEIAQRLKHFIDEGKKGLEGKIDLGAFTVQIRWDRGMIPCPFGEPGLHPKIHARLFHKEKQREIHYTQLGVHLIRKHGFFGGKGSVFRLEPAELIAFLGVGPKK